MDPLTELLELKTALVEQGKQIEHLHRALNRCLDVAKADRHEIERLFGSVQALKAMLLRHWLTEPEEQQSALSKLLEEWAKNAHGVTLRPDQFRPAVTDGIQDVLAHLRQGLRTLHAPPRATPPHDAHD